jgi:large subunit ribosomal protein L32
MAHPKRKTSKLRVRRRTRSHKRTYPTTKNCPQCGAPQQPHRVCRACGYYRGRQVIMISADE